MSGSCSETILDVDRDGKRYMIRTLDQSTEVSGLVPADGIWHIPPSNGVR